MAFFTPVGGGTPIAQHGRQMLDPRATMEKAIQASAVAEHAAQCDQPLQPKVLFRADIRMDIERRNEPANRKGRRRETPDNPCGKEAEISSKCLIRTGGSREQCQLEFQNYNLCRSFWDQVIKERRSKGITPFLPSPVERAEILEKHFQS
ncbi:hypothetical protein TTRE_0000673301 [Trichuris trichiura]|uniref:Coiled-coil-helix-coiled-coil-helix domain-containing protein 7 n=1 Tax=Trichuris trichiura TaxID=36087 RepID=A0A077ZDJ6_TRITR|nr:hypothetical protein TTRE_0000673301 [Trichuris trichiura]